MGEIIKTVNVNMVYSEGTFGINIDSIKKITRHEDELYFWFYKDPDEEERPWDMSVCFESATSADVSLMNLRDAMRRMKMKRVK